MARDIKELTAVSADTCECNKQDKILVKTFGNGSEERELFICGECVKAIVSKGEMLEIL
jgi:hypothetical protein